VWPLAFSSTLKSLSLSVLRAGKPSEVEPNSGEWLFIDVGFSSNGKSCGVLSGAGTAESLTFSRAMQVLIRAGHPNPTPLNLLIEAPLSVAFSAAGNPVGRSIERLGSQHRYWYEGPGCLVMTSALYLLRGLCDSSPQREVRLFEGFVSFKPKGRPSSHCDDVVALRQVVWADKREDGAVVGAEGLAVSSSDRVFSAFAVANMDLGVPPVIRTTVKRETPLEPRRSGG
jgi:hypothetical protein